MYAIKLNSELYSGQTANIVFNPDTGGTVDIGSVVLPYDYFVDYYYGTYNLTFPELNKNCIVYINDHYLLLENGYNLLQENNSTIII